MTATPVSRATLVKASVVGPGTGSARSNRAASSPWQKYWERKSSGRQTIEAPARADSLVREMAFFKFSSGSGAQVIWTRASLNFRRAAIAMSLPKSREFAKAFFPFAPGCCGHHGSWLTRFCVKSFDPARVGRLEEISIGLKWPGPTGSNDGGRLAVRRWRPFSAGEPTATGEGSSEQFA